MKDSLRLFPIMVVYKSQLKDTEVYQTLLKNWVGEEFMIYDNSPDQFDFDDSQLPTNAVYVRDINNGGVSKAYNTGAEYAKNKGYSHVLLLDQDTFFPPGTMSLYLQEADSTSISAPLLQMKNGHPFSPCYRRGFRTKAVDLPAGDYFLSDYSPVNSGMCIPLSVFYQAGGYNEQVKLDFADYEFVSRCKRVCNRLTILPFVAVQDFSNDEKDAVKLHFRYLLYLQSAKATKWSTLRERIMLHVEVLLHTLALTKRTGVTTFFKTYLKFLFK